MKRSYVKSLLFIGLTIFLAGTAAHAQAQSAAPPAGSEQTLQSLFSATPNMPNIDNLLGPLDRYASTIRDYVVAAAADLFIGLVLLDLTYNLARSLLTGSDLGELLGSVAGKVILYNVVYWVFLRNGYWIAIAIATSFNNLGQSEMATIHQIDPAGIATTDPLGLVGAGVLYSLPTFAQGAAWGLFSPLILGDGFPNATAFMIQMSVLGGFVTVAAFGFLAGTLTLALVEAYIVLSCGIITLGFLGSRWTQNIGTSYYSYALSVGVKLMVTYVIVGLAGPMGAQIAAYGATPVAGPAEAAAAALILAMVAWGAPNYAASIVTGSSRSNFSNYLASVARSAVGAAMIAPTKAFTSGMSLTALPPTFPPSGLGQRFRNLFITPPKALASAEISSSRETATRSTTALPGAADGKPIRVEVVKSPEETARDAIRNDLKFGAKSLLGAASFENSDAGVTNPGGVQIRLQ